MVRLVLFDIDGTLIRTGGAGTKAFERTFASEFDIPQATKQVSFAGRTDSSLVRECFRKHHIEPTAVNFRRFYDNYVFWLDHLLPESNGATCAGIPKFIDAMRQLAETPMTGLLTGNIRLGAEIKLRHYRLWDHFKMGAFGDDHEDRNELAVVAQQRGSRLLSRELKGREILVIGDTPMDIACAHRIQARVLAVGTGGYSCDQLRAHKPTWVAESLAEITAAEVCG